MTEYISAKRNYSGLTSMGVNYYIDDAELQSLYQWLDRLPLSRPKKNIAKDFSDGVLVAEIIKYYFPRLIDLHSFTPAISNKQKMDNWFHLNSKVLRKLEVDLSDDVIKALTSCKQNVAEKVMMLLREQIDKFIERSDRLKNRTHRLHKVMKHKDKAALDTSVRSSYRSHPTLTVAPVNDNVPKALFEEKKIECQAKDETIQILQEKLKKLEQLLHLKDIRIEELSSKLSHIQIKN